MKTLPLTASDDDIRNLVVEWSELMAIGEFDAAYRMLAFDNSDWDWPPELLANTIRGYGIADLHESDPTTLGFILEEWETDELRMTTLDGREDRHQIVAEIDVDRENLRSLAPSQYVGWVHYFDIPLNNERSDLTARFRIRRSGTDRIGLELLDIHVL